MSWSKDLVPTKRSYHKEYSCGYRSSSTHCSKVIRKVMVFKKWIKLQGQGHRVINNGTHPRKGLITGNIHVKYQSSSTQCSNVISKVKVSEMRTE